MAIYMVTTRLMCFAAEESFLQPEKVGFFPLPFSFLLWTILLQEHVSIVSITCPPFTSNIPLPSEMALPILPKYLTYPSAVIRNAITKLSPRTTWLAMRVAAMGPPF